MSELSNITFKQFVDNCITLKAQYEGLLSPFFNAKAVRCWKKMIYSLKMCEKQKDQIWRYLNGDIEYIDLLYLRKGR